MDKYLKLSNEDLLKTYLKLNLEAQMRGRHTPEGLKAVRFIGKEILKRMEK
jgi:hypothetical protein